MACVCKFSAQVLYAAHGTNLDGAWIRANEARLLNKGSVFKFGASSREYKVHNLHLNDLYCNQSSPLGVLRKTMHTHRLPNLQGMLPAVIYSLTMLSSVQSTPVLRAGASET